MPSGAAREPSNQRLSKLLDRELGKKLGRKLDMQLMGLSLRPAGAMSPQGEASWIAVEITRLSTELQAVVKRNPDLQTPSVSVASSVSLLTSTVMTFNLFLLYQCYRPGNDNNPFDAFVIDPSFGDLHSDGRGWVDPETDTSGVEVGTDEDDRTREDGWPEEGRGFKEEDESDEESEEAEEDLAEERSA